MPIKIISCGATRSDGLPCQQPASLEDIRYIYQERMTAGEREQVLVETHYHIHCPTCGWWTLIERIESE